MRAWSRRATGLRPITAGFRVELDDGTCASARTVVLANGVQYRRLQLDRLAGFEGNGLYYAATDLEALFCKGTEVVIVGGVNSARQAAMFLFRCAERTNIPPPVVGFR